MTFFIELEKTVTKEINQTNKNKTYGSQTSRPINKTENPEVNPCIYGQLILNKGTWKHLLEKGQPFPHMFWIKVDIHLQKTLFTHTVQKD